MIPLPKLSIKKGREYQIKRGHPWLFSGGISQAPAGLSPGDLVNLVDTDGRFVARGYFNAACDIAVRVLTRDADEAIDKNFCLLRIRAAQALRMSFLDPDKTNVYRLINAEGDYLPGIIADRFGDVIVVQSHTAGGDRLLPDLISSLQDEFSPKAIVVRNDARARVREQLSFEPPRIVGEKDLNLPMEVKENSLRFSVDPLGGQKTGFFVDQRDKRVAIQECSRLLAPNAKLANCFSYSSAFAVYAAVANSDLRTISIDKSAQALDLARANFTMNSCDPAKHDFVVSDAFAWLEEQANAKKDFEVVILDPPAFAKSHKDRQRALKAYTKLNAVGLSVCAPGGFLLTCSCSGCISLEDLETCLQTAAGNAGRSVQVIQIFKHGIDHPVNAAAKETEYLKAILCRVQ